ncbi:MAG: tetratricopeptide repeat protein [Candidatus Acidiferrum sp.]
MQIDLTGAWPRTCFFALVAFFSGMLTFLSGKAYLAAHWNTSAKPELWRASIKLEPGNAEYWRHLGLSRQWDLSTDGMQEAVRYLQVAAQVNPQSADLWMELGDAYQTSGDPVRAQEAYERAQANYPISPEVAWRYGSFLLYEGKVSDGYGEIQRAISIDSSLTQDAIAECWQSNPSVTLILDKVLPAKPGYYQSAMDFFLSRNLLDAALEVWNHERQLGLPIRMPDAIPLVDALIDQDRTTDSRRTWQQALEASHWPQGPNKDGSLIFNGGFEHDLANGGYDWREVTTSGVRFDFDSRSGHASARSLRIQFEGISNLDFHNLFQYVPVDPGTRYLFSAYLRTEGVSTDRGLGFEIFDPRHSGQLHQVTSEILGTNPWTLVQVDIVTGPETHFLKIAVKRIPSWKFDNKLAGTVWIDDVSLTPISTASTGGAG